MPKKILVADDSLTIRKMIGLIFATEDVQLTSVDNGLDALAKVYELQPELVLADVSMPGKNGYELCEAIKTDPQTQGIPVLLLGGTFEPFDENRARAAQADGHLIKPFETQALIDKAKAFLGPLGERAVSTAPVVPLVPGPTRTQVGPGPMAPPSYRSAPPGTLAPIGSTPPMGLPGGLPRPPLIGGVGGAPGIRPLVGPPLTRPPAPGYGLPPIGAMARPPLPGMPMGSRPGLPLPPSPPVPMRGIVPLTPGSPLIPGGLPRPRSPGPFSPSPGVPVSRTMPPQPMVTRPSPPPVLPPAQMPSEDLSLDDAFADSPEPLPVVAPKPSPPSPPALAAPPPVGPAAGAEGGEALLREALSKASLEMIERIAWEVVPQLAEAIIRQHVDKLIQAKADKNDSI